MALVYVIEDDDSLREILVESLVQAGLHTWGFASVDGAVEGLSQQVPDFLITDLDLGERSGLAMLEELDRHGLAIPTLLISGYLQEFGPHIPQRQGLELLAKPFDLQVLIEHVYGVLQFIPAEVDAVLEDVLEPGPMAQGFPSESEGAAPFGLFDYLQLACVGGHTVEINVFDPSDASNLIGRVLVLGGELWSTQDAQGMGSDAFLRLASVSGLIVTCNAMLQTSLARNIHCAWDALLLRAATLQDDVQERMQRGFDGDTPQAEPWLPGPVERPTFTGPPPGFATGSLPTPKPYPAPMPVQNPVEEQQPLAPTALGELVHAANEAEDSGDSAQALALLERAMVLYPGHPEILLAVMRLRRAG